MHGFSKRRWEPCYLEGGSVKKNSDVKRKTVK